MKDIQRNAIFKSTGELIEEIIYGSGIFHPFKKLGNRVREGEVWGFVIDTFVIRRNADKDLGGRHYNRKKQPSTDKLYCRSHFSLL